MDAPNAPRSGAKILVEMGSLQLEGDWTVEADKVLVF
jgi:hypothetical protein